MADGEALRPGCRLPPAKHGAGGGAAAGGGRGGPMFLGVGRGEGVQAPSCEFSEGMTGDPNQDFAERAKKAC